VIVAVTVAAPSALSGGADVIASGVLLAEVGGHTVWSAIRE
jgi:hypothetical protein